MKLLKIEKSVSESTVVSFVKIKCLLLGVVLALTACNQPPPTQSNVYQEPVPIQQDNDGIDASDVALGVTTGAVAKSAYDKRMTKQRQVVVVNKYYNGKPVSSYKKQSIRKPYSSSKRK